MSLLKALEVQIHTLPQAADKIMLLDGFSWNFIEQLTQLLDQKKKKIKNI